MRTAADNWLSSERVGRRTVWRLTPAAERLLRDGTERIFGFTAVAADWDGHWTIVIARTPETNVPPGTCSGPGCAGPGSATSCRASG